VEVSDDTMSFTYRNGKSAYKSGFFRLERGDQIRDSSSLSKSFCFHSGAHSHFPSSLMPFMALFVALRLTTIFTRAALAVRSESDRDPSSLELSDDSDELMSYYYLDFFLFRLFFFLFDSPRFK